ncbi:alpha/beta hydrolase [Nocardia cyriacigeorgica]|jgi:diacylglycerol O-acyltransferase / trehalose O-mycolyltransferase|uniref:alpha/beta hydrolase n=1 Tax=Nocardia cyriacigeorgica TaxID=135487 RepID=UPI00055DD2FF|nr:alpha/beta hydrolase family protein [Nocardia cyriacigeorgica]AVH24133.1 esterase family protein [Nocardia cyriacigeorgica]MBF6090071.1 esterase family protein [Nocardia cyriacigeorgica]MBF6095992.1 esterase family protein [Nocardia cyriacigeorgica]MBF6326386.1 esterase family protein [Nocardia cyriacigeorgica]PPJ05585.1 esterase family protein [Nocardia cyriacigeorgica]
MRLRRQVPRPESSRSGLGRALLAPLVALLMAAGAAVVGAPSASAAFNPAGFDFWVDSSMGPIKSRVFRAADGNTDRVVYALDGMRAREDLNGWEIETEVARELTKWNINVVMPVGGQSSFYIDWNAPSSFLGVPPGAAGSSSGSGGLNVFSGGPGKDYTYRWETFLTQELRYALRDRLGFNPHRNGVFGLSMGGSAALTLAAYHPDQFSFAGSFSGYLNISAPGMREAIRVAMIDAGGYNVDSMAAPWDPKWLRMDPFVFAPRLIGNNTRLWVSAASGLPTATDGPSVGTLNGMALEALALVNTRAFQVRMATLGANNVTFDFPAYGIHAWNNWQDQVLRMLPTLSSSIG